MSLAKRAVQLYMQGLEPGYVAQLLGCTTSTIYEAVKAEYGMTPAEIMQQARKEIVCNLYKQGLSPDEISAITGYCTRMIWAKIKECGHAHRED